MVTVKLSSFKRNVAMVWTYACAPLPCARAFKPIYRHSQSAVTPIIDSLLTASLVHPLRQLPDHAIIGPHLSSLTGDPAYDTGSSDQGTASIDVGTPEQ